MVVSRINKKVTYNEIIEIDKKDKGKEKGNGETFPREFYGYCDLCWQQGHTKKYCPKGEGKGVKKELDWGGEEEGSSRSAANENADEKGGRNWLAGEEKLIN